MSKQSREQRKTIGRVMHEFKHGELESGAGGKGGEVESPRQAVAIALHEAGASKYESEERNEENLKRTKEKEARGETAQQETEGKSHIGAVGAPQSSPAMRRAGGRRSARRRKSAPRKASAKGSATRKAATGGTKPARTRVAKAATKAGPKKRTRITRGRPTRRR